MESMTTQNITIKWWLLTLHGIAAMLFGLAALFWPGLTLEVLVYLFSAYILAVGLLTIMDSLISIGRGQAWILTMVLGILQLGAGVYLVRNPLVSFGIFILLIGFFFIVSAIVEVVSTLAERSLSNTSRSLRFISAALSLIVGVFVLSQPVSAGVTFVWVLGLLALINGPIAIALSLDIKKLQEELNV